MENNFLQEFLKTGLFDIGDNDERLLWLQESITDLERRFQKDYSLLPNFTLVGLDPNISDTDPAMIETESLIINHWKTLRSKYPEMPRTIIRGVIINALNNIGIIDSTAARVINLTALNFFPFAKLNKEKNLVQELLKKLGEIAETAAMAEWSLIEDEPGLKLGSLKVTDFKIGSIELDTPTLAAGMKTAIENDPITNQGTPNGGDSQWGEHFAAKSSKAIADSFNAALGELSRSLNPTSIETPINRFFSEFKKTLDSALKSSFSSSRAVERRSTLLWWKETLYSPSQKKSYRGIDQYTLPILMSSDLSDQLPTITPISVEYLLRDTLFSLNGNQDQEVSFSDYLSGISKGANKATLKPYFDSDSEREGRVSVTDFISLLTNEKVVLDDFKERTGIELKENLTFGDLSVVILRDLLTRRLVAK